jgi:gliding motility-associated-like protein
LSFNCLQRSDAGIYTCQVTNPAAPLLTLKSRVITITVSNKDSSKQVTICQGMTYPLRNRIVKVAGIYYDTFRFANRCDSIVTIHLVVNKLDTTVLTHPVCDTTKEKTVIDVIPRLNRCDSVVINQYRFDVSECIQNIEIHDWLIPNDNDGQNDFFHIPYINRLLNNRLVVFDFQGELVYQTVNYNNDGGGTDSKGNPLPAGLYRYVFSVPNPKDGKMLMRKGVIRIDYVP